MKAQAKSLIRIEGAPPAAPPVAFHLLLKPRGPICNLDCSYCFYLRKEELFDHGAFRMPDDVLEAMTKQYLESQAVPEVSFGWQGGEPTLMGVDFFRKAIEYQVKYKTPGQRVVNTLQTNGTLLDDDWCAFLKENSFLVGLSLDGPADLHDAYRIDKGGKPTFDRVMHGLKLLKKHEVEYNILCLVNRINSEHPVRVYDFLRNLGVQFIQFIPAVELAEKLPGGGVKVTDWTVRPKQWGRFLTGVFDEWVKKDVGRIFVQHFDNALEAWMGMSPSLCVHAPTCGSALAMEHDGSLFSCDHFVNPDHYLGNVLEHSLSVAVGSQFQRKFGRDKRDLLPSDCRQCPVLFACNGGCPKDRFVRTRNGEEGLNWLCGGYKQFFAHIGPKMQAMADLLRANRAPAEIMSL